MEEHTAEALCVTSCMYHPQKHYNHMAIKHKHQQNTRIKISSFPLCVRREILLSHCLVFKDKATPNQ